ncbi:MAG: DUF5666 domain-containing protein [Aquincola sp.]|nr:DUF5666 domain-containing protein [Aquincola sp.]MDH5328575.1 DUF5666 domain-containing protein [Aquincola sp.]
MIRIPTLSNFLRSALASVLLWLAACGGGVETGGTGATGAFIEGPITGFGSIIVEGVRFDESAARIEDADGGGIVRDALRLGMVVEVESNRPVDDGSGGRNATATRVRVGGSLVGPLEAVTPGGNFIRVLGQLVRLTPATVFEGVTGGVGGLNPNVDVLEVHGYPSPEAALSDMVATRVERRSSAPARFRVRGIARDVTPAGTPPTLRVGTAVFDLSASGVPGGLADGSVVRMVVGTAQSAGRWPVVTAVVESRRLEDSDQAEVEGLITSLATQRSFSVNGVPVDASNATLPATALALGTRVEVKGRAGSGVLVASSVELRTDLDLINEGIDLRGTLSGLDTVGKTFLLRGVTVFYGANPQYDPSGTGEANLQTNPCVRVRGQLDADRVRVLATRIEFNGNCSP